MWISNLAGDINVQLEAQVGVKLRLQRKILLRRFKQECKKMLHQHVGLVCCKSTTRSYIFYTKPCILMDKFKGEQELHNASINHTPATPMSSMLRLLEIPEHTFARDAAPVIDDTDEEGNV